MKLQNCPYCGEPLQRGRLSSLRDIDWTSEQEDRMGLLEGLLAPTSILEIPEPSAEGGWFSPFGEIPARHCPKCQIFLFEGRLDEFSLIPERFRKGKEKK